MKALFNRFSLYCALASVALAARVAQAADPAPGVVVLHSASCPSAYADAALQHALEVELASSSAPAAEASGVILHAECDAAASVSLRVWSSAPRLVVERSVALRDVPEAARARTLALVVAEALGPNQAAVPAEPPEPGAAPDALPFTDTDLSSPWGELFVPADPYGPPRDVRVAAGVQARVALQDDDALLAFEVGASGPLSDLVDWAVEVSHASAGTSVLAPNRDVRWWNTSLGLDLIGGRAIALALGPRFSLGHLSITDSALGDTEHTLVAQIGGRAKLELPITDHGGLQLTLALERRLGVLALDYYTGYDRALTGWLASLGVGITLDL